MTPAGRTLLHHARLVLQQMERLRGELGDYASGLKGSVRTAVQYLGLERAPAASAERFSRGPSRYFGWPRRAYQ